MRSIPLSYFSKSVLVFVILYNGRSQSATFDEDTCGNEAWKPTVHSQGWRGYPPSPLSKSPSRRPSLSHIPSSMAQIFSAPILWLYTKLYKYCPSRIDSKSSCLHQILLRFSCSCCARPQQMPFSGNATLILCFQLLFHKLKERRLFLLLIPRPGLATSRRS